MVDNSLHLTAPPSLHSHSYGQIIDFTDHTNQHGIVPIFDRSESLEGKRIGSNMKIQHTSLSDGSTRFPKLEECAHFHYDFVELGQLQLQLCEEDQENYHHRGNEEGELQFMLRVMSKDKTWNIRRSYDNFRMLDKQLHKCIFDRRFSHLPELGSQSDISNITETEMQELLQKYLKRFSSIAGSMIYCGSILNWLEMDNRGNRLLAVDDSGINTPAIAAAHAIRRYNAQAADEISLEVGDIVSVIDKPPPEDTIWWRGKRGFEVGFFPSECVEVIRDKVPQSMASRIPPPIRKPSSGPVKRGNTWNEGAASSTTTASTTAMSSSTNTVLRKHSNFISFLQRFFFTRPARNQLKRSGIVKERVFGCDLGEHLLNSGHDVPLVLKCCAEVIEKQGIIDGIYRLSGINSNIQKLRLAFDEDRMPTLTDETYLQDIHSISSLLKMYFRELPNPLLTYQLYDKFAKAVQAEDKLHLIHDVVQQLPPPHYRTTEYLIRHLARVAAFGTETGMHSKNLAIVWAPNLLRSKELELGGGVAALQGVSIQAVVTEFLICYADLIFSDKMPSYSSPELRQSQKKPRPKSLAISTPTRLLTLEEARERVLSSHNVPSQKYIDVGGGPEKLPPKYHTVLDLPGYKKKSRDASSMTTLNKPKKSPVSGWKSFFSKSRTSSVKQKVRKSSLQGSLYDTDGISSVCPSKAITEEDVHNWKKRRLRCAKSAESLLSLSSHKNSVSSSSSNPRGFIDPGMVVNLYTGEDRNRIWQHKRSLSSDASTGLRHHDLLPFYNCSHKEATASAVDFRTLPQHDASNEDSGSSSSSDSDAEKDPIQIRNIHGDVHQSFIRGDSTRRAVTYRKTSSAPSTPQQQTRQIISEKSKTQEELGNESDSDNSMDDFYEDNQDLYQMKLVKSAEFSQPLDLDNFQLMSKSDGFLVASSAADNDTRRNLTDQGMNKNLIAPSFIQWKDGPAETLPNSGHGLNTGQRQAYYSRFHDYAEIDESQISAPESVVERTTKEYSLKKKEKELELKAGTMSKKDGHVDEVPTSKDSAPESTTQLRSDLLSAIAKLEDSISPISYMQKDMCKCLSVPSDIGKSLENVNFGSQSDLMSGVSISELSQSVDSISVNDSTDFNLSCTFAANPSLCTDSATAIDLCKQINKAFTNSMKPTRESPEKGTRKSTSDIPNLVEGEKEPSKMVRFKQGSNSLDERKSCPETKNEGDQTSSNKSAEQVGHVGQLSSSVSDNCVRREKKSNVEPTKRYSHHILEHPKPESVNPLFIVESPPSLESLNSFTQMLKFYDPEEVKHMMAESSDYWSRHSQTTSEDNQTASSPTSNILPLAHIEESNQLSPLENNTMMGESKEHTPLSSPSTICKSPVEGRAKDLDLSDDNDKDDSLKESNSSLQRTFDGNSFEDFSNETLKQLEDTMESDIMVRSLPPESSLTDSLLKPKTSQSIPGSFKDKTQSEINLSRSSRKLSSDISKDQLDSASDSAYTSETPSVKRWESMEVNPSLDSVLVLSPRPVITVPRPDSESSVPNFDSNQSSCDQLSVKDSSETLISSPHSPLSMKNIYGNNRPPQSSVADLDSILNMSKEELEDAEKIILAGDDIGASRQIPLASPEVSGISDQSEQDQSSEEKSLNSQTDSHQHSNSKETSKGFGALKKSSTIPVLGQPQKEAMTDHKMCESNKPLSQPTSPIKSPSHKEGIEKLRRSFIADRKEFVSQNSKSPPNENEESEINLGSKDTNVSRKDPVCKGLDKAGDKITVHKETVKPEENKKIPEANKSKDKTVSKDTAKSGDNKTIGKDMAKSGDNKTVAKDTSKSGDSKNVGKDTSKSGETKITGKDTAKSGDSKTVGKDTAKAKDKKMSEISKSGDSKIVGKDTTKSGDTKAVSKETTKTGDSKTVGKEATKLSKRETNQKPSSDPKKTVSGGQKEEKSHSIGSELQSSSNRLCQISPPEEEVLIQIRPTLKRSSSPRRRLIEKMKKDTEIHEKRPSVSEEIISASNLAAAACGKSCRPQQNTTPQQIPQSTTGSNLTCDDDEDDGTDFSKARSLDSLLSNLKTKPKSESKSQRNDAFRCNMTSSSSDVLRGQSKSSMGTATSSDLEVIHDPEMTDSVFLENCAVDVRERKESRAGKKCATNIAKNVVDGSSNRSSLDESVLQVAAERHTAFEAAKDGCSIQQYNTASLKYPKAKKLQNLKEFFEHEELKNRPNYNRSASSPSNPNSPTCPRYQRQYRESGKKRESSRKDSMSPSRSREREATKSTAKSKTDTNSQGRSPTPSAHSPTPSAHSPTPSSRSTTPSGRSPTPSGRSPTPSGRKPAALEKWQRAESHERDGKQTWEMGVDYVLCKSPKSKSESSAGHSTPKGTAYRMRTGSESSASDVDVKSPPPQRAKDRQRKAVRNVEQSKSDTSDSESKHSFSEMECIGEEQVPRRKRKDSIKELRNYFEGKQAAGTEPINIGGGNNNNINSSVFTSSCSELSSHSVSAEKIDPMAYMSKSLTCESTTVVPRRAARSRVKSLSPVCGQSDLKSDDELSHKGSSRFSLDFSGYTTRPHVEGIVRPQPVRLGPKPFYGAKT
ncbi:uncharacterized protein LOC106869848 isoform X3 [Octopus bimaculoides]|uniref:uncharacterized protein LOC106869848 isoform X3 n=1 Tax=Octopus bimaculoides TaxID=37653 RepID=UPI00071DF3A5|nr:uncharacterized protein LOC106869848 isoform X3 [Octopus bimaculoides]|eukprot:XP_014771246.1 PREDICTED: uncharacterized protein LOC106869848 isoform X3 [Octopus bimaculoides]